MKHINVAWTDPTIARVKVIGKNQSFYMLPNASEVLSLQTGDCVSLQIGSTVWCRREKVAPQGLIMPILIESRAHISGFDSDDEAPDHEFDDCMQCRRWVHCHGHSFANMAAVTRSKSRATGCLGDPVELE